VLAHFFTFATVRGMLKVIMIGYVGLCPVFPEGVILPIVATKTSEYEPLP
jgi:hypothetical protein